MASWIDEVLLATEEAESPTQFIYWSAMCAISAVARKNVYLPRHIYNLYPNLYVMLIAKPGGRKGFPVGLARKLVGLTESTRIISGRNSIQAILSDLSKAYTRSDGSVLDKAHCFLASDEFTNLIIDEPGSLAILTQLYDTHANEPDWKNILKHSGTETLKEPCITLLGASNPSYFNSRVSAVDATGGFLRRLILVVDNSRDKVNSLIIPPKVTLDPQRLAGRLGEISVLRGEFRWGIGADVAFDNWYTPFRRKILNDDDNIGIADSLHEQVLKTAMCLSLADSNDLVLTVENILSAIGLCSRLATKARQFWEGKGISEIAPQTRIVIDILLSADKNTISRRRLLAGKFYDLDHFSLDRVVETLEQSGVVKVQRVGSETYYTMTELYVEKFNEFFNEVKTEKKVN